MNPKKIQNSLIQEEYYYMKHPSGLDIYVHPKQGYTSNYAILGTNFGSVNNKFKLKTENSYTEVPDGIAHYLEHKLFESENGDAFELFSKTGASANAYTSFEKTAYLFSCTSNFEESLSILLNFVQSPYFTEQNVEKERGIIGQEIKMYEDNPEWRVLINLLSALYKNHPVKSDIAGTIDSIAQITPEMLYKCYKTFYNLNNMALCLVGDINPDKILAIVDKNVKYAPPLEVERYFPEEPNEVAQKEIIQSFDIQSSIFNLGFKENVPTGKRCSVSELVYTDILLQCIGSRTSELYQNLLKQELINTSSFSYEHLEGPGYASIIFSGESKNPKKVAEIIREYMDRVQKNGIDGKTFERAKKVIYGQTLSAFNNVSNIANLTLDFALSGKEVFEYINTLNKACVNDINKRLENQLNSEYSALSIAESKHE